MDPGCFGCVEEVEAAKVFELFEQPSGGGAPEWVEEHTVQARDGRFSVELGGEPDTPDPRFPFNTMLLDGEPLWVAITVLEDDGRGGVREIELSGRQAIEPAVYSAWSRHAADFAVAGELDVQADLDATGDVRVGEALRVGSGKLYLEPASDPVLSLTTGDTLSVDERARRDGVVFEGPAVGVDGALRASGEVTFGAPGGANTTTVEGDLRVGSGKTLGIEGITFTHGTGTIARASEVVGGPAGVEFEASPTSGVDLRIDADGGVFAAHDVVVGGQGASGDARFEANFRVSPETRRTTDGVTSLGVHEDDGFCVLTGTLFSNNRSFVGTETGCWVDIDPTTRVWEIEVQNSGSRENMDCYARCVRY